MGPSADGVTNNPTPATLTWEAGCSRREPGLTPAADLRIPQWKTFTELEAACEQSRVDAGVHFEPSTRQGTLLGACSFSLEPPKKETCIHKI
jgi:hypothetical protein